MAAALLAALCWFALILQFRLTFGALLELGMSPADAVLRYFGYFTILTNLVVAVVTTCFALDRGPAVLRRPSALSATAVYIVIVGAIYSLLLRQIWDPQGWQKLADVLLHDAVPVLYSLFWLTCVPKTRLRWREAVRWLLYPLAYLIFMLIRGAQTGFYPYLFVDPAELGYPRMSVHAFFVTLAFLFVGLVVIAIDRALARTPPNTLWR